MRGSNIIRSQINDAYQNMFGGYGYKEGVAQLAGFPDSREISWNFDRINKIIRSEPLIDKIASTWANEMVKNGIDLRMGQSPDEVAYVEQEIKNINSTLGEAAKWGFLYGLCACIIYLDGEFNETALQKPLDMELITENSFKGLKTVIRWQGIMPRGGEYVSSLSIEHGITDPEELGEPLYYDVWFLNESKKYKVHRSRLIIFDGLKLPGIENQIEMGAGVSLVERIWVPYLYYKGTIDYIQNMLQLSQQRVLFLAEGDRIGLLSEQGQADFQRAMSQIAHNADTNNMLVLDQNDEFEYKSANFANLDRIINAAQEDFAASAYMPLNKLFGKSPTGLNNSSKENLTDFYDVIYRFQNIYMRKAYKKLIPIIYKSKYGKDIGDFSFDFKSLFMPDEQEKALIIDRKTRPLQKAWESNAMTLLDYLEELKEIGKTSDCFTNINDDTISYIKSHNLENTRISDYENGYIINSQFVSNLGELKKIYKEKLKGGNKNNEKNVDNFNSIKQE